MSPRSGTLTRKTVEVREMANRIIDDPEYREALRRHMIAGTAGVVESLIWHYAKGTPVDRVETGRRGEFVVVSNEESKGEGTRPARLTYAFARASPARTLHYALAAVSALTTTAS